MIFSGLSERSEMVTYVPYTTIPDFPNYFVNQADLEILHNAFFVSFTNMF